MAVIYSEEISTLH